MTVISRLSLLVLAAVSVAAQDSPFVESVECSLCHTRLGEKNQLGQNTQWKGSVMAHAGRDPYWQAKTAEEIRQNPAIAKVVDEKCNQCHTPQGKAQAKDGVGCSVCHLIEDKGLGTPASFTGGFQINKERLAYGPHKDPFANPMIMHVGLTPAYGAHMQKSELCATCHTVITPTVDEKGKVLGEFIEQAAYLEWKASSFGSGDMTCQSCHVPLADNPKAQYIAHNPMGRPFPPTSPRQPFGIHSFAGANFALPVLLGSSDSSMAERAHDMLSSAAMIEVTPAWKDGVLEASVTLTNLTGHKLPTGFPSRRIWLDFEVKDSSGKTAFRSGLDPQEPQPHHAAIDSPSKVQIYESEMADAAGRRTTALLRAASYLKDNRILPDGFDASKAPAGIHPAGIAGDADFLPGSDTTLYRVAGLAQGSYSIRVRALYENIKPSHRGVLSPAQVKALAALAPAVLAEATAQTVRGVIAQKMQRSLPIR
jgi:hypothetical protein